MKALKFVFVLFALNLTVSFGQATFNISIPLLYPKGYFQNLLIDNDTIVGYGIGFNNSAEWKQGLVLAKIDSSGNLIASNLILDTLGDKLAIDKYWGKIIKTSDGGYAATAATVWRESAFLIKLNKDLQVEFIREYPDTINLSNYFYKLAETPEGYLLYGAIQRPDFYDDGFIRHVDKQGNIIWHKYLSYSDYATTVQDVKRLNDSVYVAVSFTSTHPTVLKFRPSFLYFDLAGNEIKHWMLPENPDNGIVLKIIDLNEDSMLLYGHYLAGQVFNTDVFQSVISSVDHDSNTKWLKTFGPVKGAVSFVTLHDFAQTSNGDYLGAGERPVKIGDEPSRRVGWLYKFTAAGDSLWERLIDAPLPLVYTNRGIFGGVGELSSGSIVAGGKVEEGSTNYGWLVKVTRDGCLDTLYCQPLSSAALALMTKAPVRVWPNPASGFIRVEVENAAEAEAVLRDAGGREILRRRVQDGEILLPPALPNGFYLLETRTKDGIVAQHRVVVAR